MLVLFCEDSTISVGSDAPLASEIGPPDLSLWSLFCFVNICNIIYHFNRVHSSVL